MINIEQITEVFKKLPIQELGNLSGFIKKEQKITARLFVLSFFASFSDGGSCKTSIWVQKLSHLLGEPLTKQGFTKRLGWRCVDFCEQLLSQSLVYTLSKKLNWSCESKWLKNFNRVFLEDSTALKLPKSLYWIYGGGTNQAQSYAIARVQLRLEIGTERIHKLSIRNYAEQDSTFAADILSYLKRGDLLIRDLGYFVIEVFEAIEAKGAFFITRWHPKVRLRCTETQLAWDLGKVLADAERRGIELIDQNVLLGLKNAFKVRFIAIKVPQEVEQKRRKSALDRAKKKGVEYSQKYFEPLGWAIYITNIPAEKFDFSAIWAMYRLRWRIEIIFKAWKSHLKILQVFKDWQSINPCQTIIRLYLVMAWIVLCLIPAYNYFSYRLYKSEQRHLSLAKFADYFCSNFFDMSIERNRDKHIPFLKCFCLYDKRKKYHNYFENLYMLNLC
jgi:hypothetical protein